MAAESVFSLLTFHIWLLEIKLFLKVAEIASPPQLNIVLLQIFISKALPPFWIPDKDFEEYPISWITLFWLLSS